MLASAGFAASAQEAKAQNTQVVDADHITANCPLFSDKAYYDSDVVGQYCYLSYSPLRLCVALYPAHAGLPLSDLYDSDVYYFATDPFYASTETGFCDDVLAFCPDGQTDKDGNYFTEGDCEEVSIPPHNGELRGGPRGFGGKIASDIPSGGEFGKTGPPSP